jgi:hypothetical protein
VLIKVPSKILLKGLVSIGSRLVDAKSMLAHTKSFLKLWGKKKLFFHGGKEKVEKSPSVFPNVLHKKSIC